MAHLYVSPAPPCPCKGRRMRRRYRSLGQIDFGSAFGSVLQVGGQLGSQYIGSRVQKTQIRAERDIATIQAQEAARSSIAASEAGAQVGVAQQGQRSKTLPFLYVAAAAAAVAAAYFFSR